ncbi:alcohol dehydrogenase catalytic domain-containing protein [Natroniella acetigena]|uniref:zinc-dependent alcohol dehydrogenase n=1 Tax=Natroniella acetigena TaxID=52004 RepID=UPI00200A5167|nr:alcohol dehydrogenase catalytic domain-containing protein [Natroniella acetigena]MCK8827414.1 alcohol dehydrogenase catalytic domain-containing protein [Natroniella acetigena]
MTKMKAARIFGEKEIKVVEIPRPEVGPEEVLIRVKAVGLCGTDVELYEGTMPYIERGDTVLPITPGHEWAGVVEEVGEGVSDFGPGDRVTGDVSLACGDCSYCMSGSYNLCPNRRVVGSYKNKDGGFAEYIIMPERHLYCLPENITFPEAAMVESAATCVYGIEKTGIEFGSTVLVIGDGPIGQLAAQSVAASGAGEVILSGSYDQKLAIAEKTCDAKTINRYQQDVIETVMDYTGGIGADIVIEACGNELGLKQAIEAVKPGGKLCLLSIYPQDELTIDLNTMVFKDLEIHGSLASPNAFQPTINMLKAGKIKTEELNSHTLSLEDVEDAFDLIYNNKEEVLKIILTP